MNVLIVAYYFGDWKSGGSERTITRIADYLLSKGHNCLVAVPETARPKLLNDKNIPYVRIGKIRSLNPINLLRLIYRISTVLKEEKIDCLLVLTFRLTLQLGLSIRLAALEGWRGCNNSKIPLNVLQVMGWVKAYCYTLPLLAVFVDRVFAYTWFSKNQLNKIKRLRHKVTKFSKFIDVDAFRKAYGKRIQRLKRRSDESSFVVATVSRLVKRKGLKAFLEMSKKLISAETAGIDFWIVGEGQLGKELKDEARSLGVENKVKFVGVREDILQLLSEIDVFVSLTERDEHPWVLIDALAGGVPVITTQLRSNEELIEHGKNGFLVHVCDVEDAAFYVRALLNDHKLANSIGHEGHNMALERFDSDKTLAGLLSNLEMMVSQSPSAKIENKDQGSEYCIRPHIVFISGAFPPQHDGVGDYTAKLSTALVHAGWNVNVITTSYEKISPECFYRKSTAVVPVYHIAKKWNLIGILKVLFLVSHKEFDIVHIQYPSVLYRRTFLFCILPWLLRIICGTQKVFLTLHEFQFSRSFNRIKQRTLSALSDFTILTTQRDLDALRSCRFKENIESTAVVPVGSNIEVADCNESEKDKILEKIKRPKDSILLSFFGNIHSNKGFEYFLDAFESIADRRNDVALLVISEPDLSNAYCRNMLHRIEKSRHKERIHVTGYLPENDVSHYLSASDICVLPFTDGASLRRASLLAVMQHGIPAVSTVAERGSKDIFENLNNILLVQPFSSEAIERALDLLIDDENLRRKIGENAKKIAYIVSWEKIAKTHISIYEKAFFLQRK